MCAAEKQAASEIAASGNKDKVLVINVDEILSEDPSHAEKMFDSFDLSTLPFIIQTDRKGRIQRRYISLVK